MKKDNLLKSVSRGSMGAGTIYVIAILSLLVVFSFNLTKGVTPSHTPPSGPAVTIVPPNPSPEQNNLQLYTFGYTTPAPTPTPAPPVPTLPPTQECRHVDELKTPSCGGPCLDVESIACPSPDGNPCSDTPLFTYFDGKAYCLYWSEDMGPSYPNLFGQKSLDPNCQAACFGKPVIYLYPKKPTLVDVKLAIPGRIVESDPLYPTGGWKNVLAYPDGKLIYQSKTYHELYYESEVEKAYTPENGIVIPTAHLKSKLTEITTKLGLIKPEQSEFLDYWLPKLNKLNSPYILFSILGSAEKERVDHVDISPAPDTKIEFLVYFKAQKSSTTILKPLSLPQTPPARVGFTSVEWGGTIAN